MEDIAPDLLTAIREEFTHSIQRNRKIITLYEAIQKGTVTYQDVGVYAYEIGEALSRAMLKHLSSTVLPDGRMYFNIADRVLRPLLEENHGLISDAAMRVQTDLNHKAGIGLKAQSAKINDDRISGIVNKVSNAGNFDDVTWVLNEPVKTFAQSVVDDTLKANVQFQGRAGLKPVVIRKSTRECCEWCKALAGEYDYPDVPEDVYHRHERCRCTVDYDPGSGKRQNVWTKNYH